MESFKVNKFVKILAVLLFPLLIGCVNKQRKQYNHICDSLNRLDFPPRQFDTLFFHKYENGDIVDTVYPDGRYEFIQTLYNGNYYRLMREKDYPVVNAMQYDRDGNYYTGIRNFFMEKPSLLILWSMIKMGKLLNFTI